MIIVCVDQAMELISMAQHEKEISNEDHVEALREGIPEARMDGMSAIAQQLPTNVAPMKSSYTPGMYG